mgnify:CR=1 FL=1
MKYTPNLNLNISLSSTIYDLITYLSIVIFLIILLKKKKISIIDFYLLAIFCATPFISNNVIFHWDEFPDQKKYIDRAWEFRHLLDSSYINSNVFFSSLIYSIFPVISFTSINTIAFINKFLIIYLYVLFKKENVNKLFLYSLILYPSIIIYSSLSLRDIMLVFFMIISAFYFFKKNYLIFLVSTLLLYLVKEQYAIYLFLSLVIYRYFIETKKNTTINIVAIFITLVVLYMFEFQILETVERYRQGFIKEIGGYSEALNVNKGENLSFKLFVNANYPVQIIFSYLKTFLYPLTTGFSPTKFIFFIDNILFSVLFFLNCFILFKKNKRHVSFWFINYVIINIIISYISINDMTLLRYKFPWVIFCIFCLSYTCRNKQPSNANKKKISFFK